jgi:chemotaxis protein CheD
MAANEQIARMGEWVTSAEADGVLACIGLGSCIGLALLDRRAGVAGLAHVMLPESPPAGTPQPGKFADLAVPALLADLEALGAARHRLEAVLVGGAQMFSFAQRPAGGAGQEIGARNEDAVREQLRAARITVRAAATGGDKGRSMRVFVAGEVVCREAAGTPETLLGGGVLAGAAA